MSSSPPPAPQPEDAGEGVPRPSEQITPVPEHQRQERPQGYRTDRGAIPPSPQLNRLFYRFDPFIAGVMIGAIVAIIGVLLGLFLLLLN